MGRLKGLDMKYNILIESTLGGVYNLMEVDESKLPIVIEAYEYAKTSYTLSGRSYTFKQVTNFQIFTFENEFNLDDFNKFCIENSILRINRIFNYSWYDEKCLELLGKNVTENFIGNNPFGYKSNAENKPLLKTDFVCQSRVDELKAIRHPDFDLSRLIKLCEEINVNYKHQNFLSVGMIGRTILNHIPPIFGFDSFDKVASQYGGKSFKNNMQSLNSYFKNTVDLFLHQPIRKIETLPTEIQIEFKQPFEILFEEIIRILKTQPS